VVPIEDSNDILAKTGEQVELFVIEGADHVFGEHVQGMVEKVAAWLLEQWR
jgi:fermentation-respiration switch protein FrsA (DUF1100 family)